jgi:hypothetical protein
MSNKETLIEWIQQLPDDQGIGRLLASLRERYEREQPAGDDYEWPAPDLTDDEWRQVVARSFRELADPREDIYGPEDGKPLDEQG